MITCIVPVYNNEKTIGHVIKTVLSFDPVDELIVIDNFSTDNTREVIKSFGDKINAIFNPQNLGKGGSVAKGIKRAKGNVIFLCDADLAKLNTTHLKNLFDTFFKKNYDMVIGGREFANNPISKLTSTVSGERILYKKNILPYLDIISTAGYGIEQISNYAHRNLRVRIIAQENIGHVLKCHNKNPFKWGWGYIHEGWQILQTAITLRGYSPQ